MEKAGSTTSTGAGAPGRGVAAPGADSGAAATGPLPVTTDAPATSGPATPATPAAKPATGKPAATKPAPSAPAKAAAPAPATPAAAVAAPAPSVTAPPTPTTVTPTLPPVATDQRPAATTTRPVGPRRARLLVTRLDPWSVMKTAFMLSVSLAVVVLVAIALLWWTLSVTGVFAAIGRTIDDVAGSTTTSFDFLSLVGFSRVMGVALVLAAIEIVLVSALTTLFAFLYNLSVGLTGGLEVTLSEDS